MGDGESLFTFLEGFKWSVWVMQIWKKLWISNFEGREKRKKCKNRELNLS